LDNTEMNL
jgi:hypothetical protein